MNVGRGLFNMFRMAMAVIFWIVVLKLITAKYDLGPVTDIVAMV
jgi:hypothetical protein